MTAQPAPDSSSHLIKYNPVSTIDAFHRSDSKYRCIVGPVGSGKTAGATWEIIYYLAIYLARDFGINNTRWAVLRNTYPELEGSTMRTVFEWFPPELFGKYRVQKRVYEIRWDHPELGLLMIDIDFLACDRPDDIKKLKSREFTGYWIDESIEVPQDIKLMLANRIGRYPKASYWPVKKNRKTGQVIKKDGKPVHDVRCYGIETTNPPDVEHSTYSNFAWNVPPPGPIPSGDPLDEHTGFWQPPEENVVNLRDGYYDDLRNRYRDNPDWIEIYIEGKPGATIRGKLVYNNFKRTYHVAQAPLIWAKGPLFRGWDNSGNCPACIVLQVPRPRHIQVLKEFTTDKMNIVDFTGWVVSQCNTLWPGAGFTDWADPAGENKYSTRQGTYTSNAQLMREAYKLNPQVSEQNLAARINAVDSALGIIDGLLIDPGCTRLINGFIGGYSYKEKPGLPGEYSDVINKNRFAHIQDALQYVVVKLLHSSSGGRTGFQPKRRHRAVRSRH
jgi:hypothetical protein